MKRSFGNPMSRTALYAGMLIMISTSVSAYEYSDLGTIILTSRVQCPPMMLEANGQILEISSNVALFSALGVAYGGDGRRTFGLPDLRDAVPRSSNGRELRYCIISSMTDETGGAAATSDGTTGDQSDVSRGRRGEAPGGQDEIVRTSAPRFNPPSRITVGDPTSTSLTVGWHDNSNNEDGFIVEQLDHMTAATGFRTRWSTVATVRHQGSANSDGMGARTHTMRNLRSGTNYCYRVRAFRGGDTTEAAEHTCERTREVVN